MKLAYRTRGGSSPQGKPRVYFTAHPQDYEPFFQSIADDIFRSQNCAIYYDEEPWRPASPQDLEQLAQMQLMVVPVTRRFLTQPSRAREVELPFAAKLETPIPVLPLMQEPGLEKLFNEVCGELQTIGRDRVVDREKALAGKVQSYEEKLDAYLDSILVGDELIARIRSAFDAYIFLSYRKIDRDDAQKLMRLIHSNDFCRDIAIWYDEFLVPGRDFNKAIQDAMEKSGLFVLTVTPNLLAPGPDGGPNFVMGTEYPRARDSKKPIFPVMMQPTDQDALYARYERLPDCADPRDGEQFRADLLESVKRMAIRENDHDPQHNFFIGLAYLNGIDVEKDGSRALKLITGAAEAGLPEAYEQLVRMYRTGNGVRRDYRKAIQWQERLVRLYERRAKEFNDPEAAGNLVTSSWSLGDYCMELPDYSGALGAYRISLDACQALIRMGQHANQNLGRPAEDPAAFLASTMWMVQAKGVQPFLPACYDNVADAFRGLGRLEDARQYYECSLRINRAAYEESADEENRHRLFLSLQRLGDLCQRAGDTAGAGRYYQELEELTGETSWQRDKLLMNNKRGDEAFARGDLARAEVYYQRQYALARELYAELRTDESREDLCASCGRMAQICWMTGRLEEAERYAQENLACAQEWRESSESWPARYHISIAFEHIGMVLRLMKKPEEAERNLLESLTIRRRLYAQQPTIELLESLVNLCRLLAVFLLEQGRFQAAWNCGVEMYDAAKEAHNEAAMDQAAYLLYQIADIWHAHAAELVNERRYQEALGVLVEARDMGKYLSELGRAIRDEEGHEVQLRPLAAMIQWNLRVVHINLGDFERAAQAGFRSGNLFTKLWQQTGDSVYGENAAKSWRHLVSMYTDKNNMELAAYYAQQAAALSDGLYRQTGEGKYLSLLAEDFFKVGSCRYNQGSWQEAVQWYSNSSGACSRYFQETGDRSYELLVLACKCELYMGLAHWELKNFQDAKDFLRYALDWACKLSEDPDGFCLPPQAVVEICERLLILAGQEGDWVNAGRYAEIRDRAKAIWDSMT